MRVAVDRDLCEANGVSAGLAPEVFDLDDEDYLHILAAEVPAPVRCGPQRGRVLPETGPPPGGVAGSAGVGPWAAGPERRAAWPMPLGRPAPKTRPTMGMPASKTPKTTATRIRVAVVTPPKPMPMAAARLDRPTEAATRRRASTR
jgi:hypothetical protein